MNYVSIRHADFRWFQRVGERSLRGRCEVSIRHADFRWFQRLLEAGTTPVLCSFNPPCGFSVVSTKQLNRQTAGVDRFNPPCGFSVVSTIPRLYPISENVSFNPPCGFSVVSTPETANLVQSLQLVSIRHADFRWFQLRAAPGEAGAGRSFNPPCGFSVVSTQEMKGLQHDDHRVSIRHADFRWFQPVPAASGSTPNRVSFNPPCGFSVVSTSLAGKLLSQIKQFQSAMRIFGGFNL